MVWCWWKATVWPTTMLDSVLQAAATFQAVPALQVNIIFIALYEVIMLCRVVISYFFLFFPVFVMTTAGDEKQVWGINIHSGTDR
jgi:hypothetical protein